MTYVWRGKGCLRCGGKFYADGQIIPHEEMAKDEIERLLKSSQIKKVSIDSVGGEGAGKSAPDLESAERLVEKCQAKVDEWAEKAESSELTEPQKKKALEWDEKLEVAEKALSELREGGDQ